MNDNHDAQLGELIKSIIVRMSDEDVGKWHNDFAAQLNCIENNSMFTRISLASLDKCKRLLRKTFTAINV